MTLREAIQVEAARVHMFTELADGYGTQAVFVRAAGGTEEECRMLARHRDTFEHRAHISYLAMVRLESATL